MNATPATATWRIAMFVLVLSSIVWLGGANIRAMIGNHLLRFGTTEFDDVIAPEAEREIFRLLSLASLTVIGSYLTVVIAGSVFLVTSPFRLKEHGWLMMSAILFYVFLPVEVFTMILDGRMVYLEFFTTAGSQEFRELFIARLTALAGVPFIGTLCYITIIGLAVFQPLKLTDRHTS